MRANPLCHAFPALRPVRALLFRIPLGPRPWLHQLRCGLHRFVRRLHSYSGGVRLLVSVRHRLRLLAFPMRTATLGTNTRPRRPDTRSPSSARRPSARDVALDPGKASAPRNDGAAHDVFERMKALDPCDIDLARLNRTPHAIAVYASSPLSPAVTQHSLPSGRYPLLGPDFHRLDHTSLRLAHSFDDLVGAGEQRMWYFELKRFGGL